MENISKNIINKKYPISQHNRQCLGPCYEKGTWIVHPVTLKYIVDFNNHFCPTNEWEYLDPDTGEHDIKYTDACYIPTNNKDISQKEIEMNALLPEIEFDCLKFLKIYYDLHSFEDILNWITLNKQIPILTKLRIMECAWESFGKDLDFIDDRLVDFYEEIIKKRWIKKIYNRIKKYIFVDRNEKIYLKKEEKYPNIIKTYIDKKDRYKTEKINFIIKTFVTKNNIYKFLSSYIEKYKHKWNDIRSHSSNLKEYFIEYIINKIHEIIK